MNSTSKHNEIKMRAEMEGPDLSRKLGIWGFNIC